MEEMIPVCCDECCYVVGESVGRGMHLRCKRCDAEVLVPNFTVSEVVAQGFEFNFDFSKKET